jgi:hypothetical protein
MWSAEAWTGADGAAFSDGAERLVGKLGLGATAAWSDSTDQSPAAWATKVPVFLRQAP